MTTTKIDTNCQTYTAKRRNGARLIGVATVQTFFRVFLHSGPVIEKKHGEVLRFSRSASNRVPCH
jgi:hypothetical protein